ncbi:MAG: methyltransferase domain-containing protein [Bacteroidota bacterium]
MITTSKRIEEIKLEMDKSLIDYYEKAGPDYEHWSKQFNMHFGYWTFPQNPFNLEALLNNMNELVLENLQLDVSINPKVLDAGCGLGATTRYIASKVDTAKVTGITIVPWQVNKARLLNSKADLENVEVMHGHYEHTRFENGIFDAAFAIESSCYALGKDKGAFLTEMHRVLKPGARLVVCDGFIKKPLPAKSCVNMVYNKLCKGWVLDHLAQFYLFIAKLKALGFKDIQVKDLSWNVAPTVAHVPFKTFTFLIKQLFKNGFKEMNRERWNNLMSPLLTMVLGLHRKYFSYYMISAVKG